ncbi:MAG: hypothetical protein K9H49_05075 [Bacteroidales bacterium]|nr:hypothetical protein [Bacteroidales bacterium]MCF8392011.1 hypothetical protein [Bacteroidales bacterium]
MRQIAIVIFILLLSMSCKNSSTEINSETDGVYKIVVEEVLQTSQYTYIRTTLDKKEQWLATSSRVIETGSTYYYKDGLLMTNFKSQELDRTFDEILFLNDIFTTPPVAKEEPTMGQIGHAGTVSTEKHEVSVPVAEGGISIAELYENKDSYTGKKVKVSGEVVKFNPEIMGVNWIHLQDGTDFQGQFDLTVTSDQVVAIGDIVTFEGVIAVDKDFGYGYFYNLLMEEGAIVK